MATGSDQWNQMLFFINKDCIELSTLCHVHFGCFFKIGGCMPCRDHVENCFSLAVGFRNFLDQFSERDKLCTRLQCHLRREKIELTIRSQ